MHPDLRAEQARSPSSGYPRKPEMDGPADAPWLESDSDDGALVERLRGAAVLPLPKRVAYLGLASMMANASERSPAARAAAVECLAGCAGIVGLSAIVRALDDEAMEVRVAAVDALRKSSMVQPLRWAHALFHRRLDVRERALDVGAPEGSVHLVPYLRAHPQLRSRAAAVPWRRVDLRLMIDLYRRGAIEASEVVREVASGDRASARAFFSAGAKRGPAMIRDYLARWRTEQSPPVTAPGYDILDEWCAIVEASGDEKAIGYRATFEIVDTPDDRTLSRRALVSWLAFDELTEGRASFCAKLEPASLRFAAAPLPLRRAACRGISRFGSSRRSTPDGEVDAMLASELVQPTGELGLDLVAAAYIVGLRSTQRIERWLAIDLSTSQVLGSMALERARELVAALARHSVPANDQVAELIALVDSGDPAVIRDLAVHAMHVRVSAGLPTTELWLVLGESWTRGQALTELIVLDAKVQRADAGVRSGLLDVAIESGRAATLIQAIGPQIDGRQAIDVLRACADAENTALAQVIADWLLSSATAQVFEELASLLPPAQLGRMTAVVERALAGYASRRSRLAEVAQASDDAALRAWGVRLKAEATTSRPTTSSQIRALSAAERKSIVECDDGELDRACLVALDSPRTGLTDALSSRAAPLPSAMACAALMGCRDPLAQVAATLEKFWDHDSPDFADVVHNCSARNWAHDVHVNLAGNALLWRWDRHADEIQAWLNRLGHRLDGVLAFVETLPGRVAGPIFWEALARLCIREFHRDRKWLDAFDLGGARMRCLAALGSAKSQSAARLLVVLAQIQPDARARADLIAEIHHRADAIDDETRFVLRGLSDFDGIPRRAPRPVAQQVEIPWWRRALGHLMSVWTGGIEEHVVACGSVDLADVSAGLEALLSVGEPGELALATVLGQSPPVTHAPAIARSVASWRSAAAVTAALRLIEDVGVDAKVRFFLALSCLELAAGVGRLRALEIACEENSVQWFGKQEWDAAIRALEDIDLVAAHLVSSPQHLAYRRAVEHLCEAASEHPASVRALMSFMRVPAPRPADLRARAAAWLWRSGESIGLAEIATKLCTTGFEGLTGLNLWRCGERALETLLGTVVDAALVAGGALASPGSSAELRAVELLDAASSGAAFARRMDGRHRRRLLLEGSDDRARAKLVQGDMSFLRRDRKLVAIASVFAWGVRRGRDLTGRLFGVHMTHKRKDLGHTRLSESRIFVSPLPLLRGDPDGRDVVEGLILHEFGHHLYHAGPGDELVWKRAQREGLFGILNLVADEHLERNLRSIDVRYGDRLKRLAAFAFQHDDRDIAIDSLLGWLGVDASEVLGSVGLQVAYPSDSVRTSNHALLAELDRIGNSFARFVKALRMGQGNRSQDPVVDKALALFPAGRFRHETMAGLWEITQQLAELFGIDSTLANCFGGHESLEWGERDSEIHGEGIGDEEVQREVERILDPRRTQAGPGEGAGGKPSRLQINVDGSEWFAPIDVVERIPKDLARHREIAKETRTAADRLREVLERLGLRAMPQRARLRGRAFDRTQTMALVIRRDPRILIAREMVPKGDLFIGVAIDCSGSMSTGQSIEKAHRFCVTLAEAVKDLRGIDARFFGFTDRRIYDAGDARDCAAAALAPNGGNNDAAGLQHVAKVALASPRRHKLIVMVSDGLPTECTIGALRGLVRQLERRHGLLCAQVAVRPLEEKCFNHYVEIAGDDVAAACVKFSRVVADLVARTQSA